jgi:polyferredoxin
MSDLVNHPPHYTSHPSNIECIEIAETMDFCPGNALKYVWRFREKGGVEDLNKALWYVRREIELRERERSGLSESINLTRAMAYEPNPTVAMIFWYLTAGDHMHGEQGAELFKEVERLIEGLIHDAEPTPR